MSKPINPSPRTLFREIPRVPLVDRQTFYHEYFRPKTPVVFTQVMDNWSAMQRWSPEFFNQLAATELLYAEQGNVFQETTRFQSVRFQEYIQAVFNDEGKGTETLPYLADFDILGLSDSLLNDVDFGLIETHTVHTRVNGWIGPAGTIGSFHVDWADNLFAQIRGSKLIKLVSPEFNANMYPSRKFDSGSWLSSVDADAYDAEKHPLFQDATIYHTVLGPGEMLYIPYGWWHYVRSLEPSISINCFGWTLKQFCTALQATRVKKFLHRMNLYGRYECTCHMHKGGKRISRPMHY